jgi:hypothetical protein
VVLLGLNPETRLKTVTDYLKSRGVSDGSVSDLVLRHPRIFEYKVGDVLQFRCRREPQDTGGAGLLCIQRVVLTWCRATRASSSTRWARLRSVYLLSLAVD